MVSESQGPYEGGYREQKTSRLITRAKIGTVSSGKLNKGTACWWVNGEKQRNFSGLIQTSC